MVSYTLEEQNAIINEFLDVIEANDMIGDLQNICAGHEFYMVNVSFQNSTSPENIDEQIRASLIKHTVMNMMR